MIRVCEISKAELWDTIVKSFTNYDVYYLSGYVKAFMINGDGQPELLYYEFNGLRAIYVYMKREIAIGLFDSITPYGYGGVLFEGDISVRNIECFYKAYEKQMSSSNIVSNFVRYHPVLENANFMKDVSNVTDLGRTIAMDLTSPEIIWQNIHTKNRNMIRKAEKNRIEIRHGKGMELLNKFMEIYNATMERDNAEDYYFFKHPFYECIDRDIHDNYEVFYALYEGQIIAMSIMIFANGRLNYHLSGSDFMYRNLAPSNLLLYKAALWGCEQNMKTFHLGGGVGSEEDNLFKFKIAFNKNSNCRFSIGKEIFDQDQYQRLVEQRRVSDPKFKEDSSFFPLYRS